jgi:hypothetical protein
MTDAQWASVFPRFKTALLNAEEVATADFDKVFIGISSPKLVTKIVLEITPTSTYSICKIVNNTEMLFDANKINNSNVLSAVVAVAGGVTQAKVDAKDAVRMAKAPVNGKAFAAQDTRWYWLGYFLLET